jgi:Flp pilus assembly protein TadD
MANIFQLPLKAPSRLGFERARKSKSAGLEHRGQMSLFSGGAAPRILPMQGNLSPFEQALVLDEKGDHKAAEAYRTAIGQGDAVADAYCNLGILEFQAGRTAKAIDCFTEALKHDPRHFESHYNLGNMYFEVGNFKLAKVHYEVAVELAPTFPNVYFNLGLVEALSQDFSAAIGSLGKYKELAPPGEGKKADELVATLKRSLGPNR